ncbi:hypothetical protein IJ425_06450 [bacterium]|nr:hypothetical protein [bacterium]
MDSKDEKYLILEQYRIYSEAKERFIERQFTSNRFYLIVNLVILVVAYLLGVLFPQYGPVIILSIIGIAISVMWWLNIDSYQMLISIKYAKVLEYLETKLPEQPYHKEYIDYVQTKKKKNLIVFGDFQKMLALVIICVYTFVCIHYIFNIVKFQMMM